MRAGILTVTRKPRITGTSRVGKSVKYVAGTTSPPTTTRTYRWLRGGKPISGATKPTRTLTKADKGHTISLRVTYRKTGYTTVVSTTARTRKVT